MNCPICGADMEGAFICPNCGAEVELEPELIPEKEEEEIPEPESQLPGIYFDNILSNQADYVEYKPPEDHKLSLGEKSIVISGLVFLLAMMVGLFLTFQGYDPDAVAIAGNDDLSMDNRTFSIYYQNAYQSFIAQYEEALPFDSTRSLKKQYYNVKFGYTWEDYFISQAYSKAVLTAVLATEAEENGVSLEQSQQAQLDAAWETIAKAAESNAMTPVEYVEAMYGAGMTEEAYRQFLADNALAQAYYTQLYYGPAYSDQEIETYYEEHRDSFSGLYISRMPNIDVRHILLMGDTQVLAEEILKACQEQEEPEKALSALAGIYSQDAGSYANGGLLENLAPGSIGGEFDAWCFDEAGREPGDMAAVPSGYGWHVVYFEGYRENFSWKEKVVGEMRTQNLNQQVEDMLSHYDCSLTKFATSVE